MHSDFSREALLYPDRRPVFVGVEQMAPFDPRTVDYSPANAWWLANLCQLAYYQNADIEQELAGVAMQLAQSFCGPCAQGFLATGAGFAVLAYRGTEIEQWPDILADAEFILVPVKGVPKVHAGFQRALDEVWPEVLVALDEAAAQGLAIWYTGYSLGAALSTLSAARRPPVAMITFGSPRVGNKDFADLLCDLPIQRFVNCCDIVPQAPPPSLGYVHVGELDFITSHGRILRNPEPRQIARYQLLGQIEYAAKLPWLRPGMVKSRALADHAIVNYIAGVRNEILYHRS